MDPARGMGEIGRRRPPDQSFTQFRFARPT